MTEQTEARTTESEASPQPAPPAKVMSIHAHPDDQEFSVGGTLALWAKAVSEHKFRRVAKAALRQ